jgi:lysylphosphatidylglycerol synthetase-like protein (DUF2156 family)
MATTISDVVVANITEAIASTIVQNLTIVTQPVAAAVIANLTVSNVTSEPVVGGEIIAPEPPVQRELPNEDTTIADPDAYFWSGLTQSFILVFLAEIGDKTFIMVMLLANKMNKLVLWFLATVAMNIMNAISVTIGSIFPLFIPKIVISIVVIVLFFIFGLKMLYTGLCQKDEGNDDELEEAKETLEKLDALKEKQEPLLPQS